MGVYIKKMEMPKSGFVDVRIFADGVCTIADGAPPYYKEYHAVPVPQHGRLIDASAFVRGIRDAIHYDASRGREYISAEDLQEVIENAPTIIPASEEAE